MQSGWGTLKAQLISQGLLDKFFSKPLDRRFSRSKTGFKARRGAYFPLLMETHLRDVAAHLDRILSYRREMYELEVLAVRAGADFALQKEQSKAELDLSLMRLRKAQSMIERDAQTKAVTAFGSNGGDVSAGLKEISTGAAARLGKDLEDAVVEERLLREMYGRSRDYEELYWKRHNEPGNAHNYTQRARNFLELLLQDKYFAERKCQALNIGFQEIYGRPPQVKLPEDGAIDALVMWVRSLFEDIVLEDELESEFDVVVPLMQPLKPGATLVSADDWKNALGNAAKEKNLTLEFELKPAHLPAGSNIRIKRAGLSYGTRMLVQPTGLDRSATYESYRRYRGELIPPPYSRPEYKRPPVTLGSVGVYGGPVDHADGPEITNRSPFGKWRVSVEPHPTTKEIDLASMISGADGSTPWLDVKLHLRLRAKRAN